MVFSELCTEVQAMFRRPDKQALVESKVKEAIHAAHTRDKFQRDVVEFSSPSIVCGGVRNAYTLNMADLGAQRFRSLVSVQLLDSNTGLAGNEIVIEDFPQASFDMYGVSKAPCVTAIGDSIIIELGDAAGYVRKFYVLYVAFPSLTSPIPESWIMRDFPYLIISDALARLYRITGNAEQAGAARMDAEEQMRRLVESALVLGA